jgi:nucleoside recognition membrane protein YjiH
MVWIALALCAVAAVAIIALASPSNDETELFFKKLMNRVKKHAKQASNKLSEGQEVRNLAASVKEKFQEEQASEVRECRACQHLIC